MAWKFRTVPDELVATAETLATHYKSHGYTVSVEHTELAFPNTPTFQAKRANTRVVVEIVDRIDRAAIERWVAYGKSNGRDFRVVVGVAATTELSGKDEKFLRAQGAGCEACEADAVIQRIPPTDLALNVALPPLGKMPARVRTLLGPAYEQFVGRGDWREGFGSACQAFEDEARRYLKRHSKTGRIQILKKGKATTLTAKAIDKMPMGVLAHAYRDIITRNLSDSVIGETLAAVNKDRIGLVHKKTQKTVETRLRKNVGRHMWMLYNGFRAVIK